MYRDELEVVEYQDREKKSKKMSKKSVIIWSLVLLAVFVLTVYFWNRQSTSNYYIILDYEKAIEYSDGTYHYVPNNDYLRSNYRVFQQNNYIGSYYISKVDNFTGQVYFSNPSSSERYVFNNPMLALSTNIEYIPFQNLDFDVNDFDLFYNVSSKDYIVQLSDIYDYSKVTLDFDHDGSLETLYTVTYERVEDDEVEIHEYNYSLFYYVDEERVSLIAEGEPYNDGESVIFPNYIIRYVIDLEDDGIYEVVVENRMYDEPIYEFYSLKEGKYQLMFVTDLEGDYE